jgi:hypothetical protein
MIRKLASGGYRLYSRKKDKQGKRKNLGTFPTLEAAKKHEQAKEQDRRNTRARLRQTAEELVGSFGGSSYLSHIRISPSSRFRLKAAFKRRFRFLHVASARSGSGFATGAGLGQRASTARLIPPSRSLPRPGLPRLVRETCARCENQGARKRGRPCNI